MTRQEIINAMQERQILITRGLMDAIAKMPDRELAARWAGIQKLAETHRPGNISGWMGKHFGNPTTLFIGQKELERQSLENARKIVYARKQQEEAEAEARLSGAKMRFWHRCVTKRRLLEKHLIRMDETFQEMIRKNFLDNNSDLDALPKKQVLLWFWYLIPPFVDTRAPPLSVNVPFEKAS
jgi:hypothetical protein